MRLIGISSAGYRNVSPDWRPTLPGAVFAVIGLILTAKAAPIMLSLRSPQSVHASQRAFEGFFFWGLYLRGAADSLAFLAEVVFQPVLRDAGCLPVR
jgi:hypothetical protein